MRAVDVLGGAAGAAVAGALVATVAHHAAPPHHPLLENVIYAGLMPALLGCALTLQELSAGTRTRSAARLAAGVGWPLLAGLAALAVSYALFALGGSAGEATLGGSLLRGHSLRGTQFGSFIACALARLCWALPMAAAVGLARLRPAEWRSRGRAAAVAGALGGALASLASEVVASMLQPLAGRPGVGILPLTVHPEVVAGAAFGAVTGAAVVLADLLGPVARLLPAGGNGHAIDVFAPEETLGASDDCSIVRGALVAPLAGVLRWQAKPPCLALRSESPAGFEVNGEAVGEAVLEEGDEVLLGGIAYRVAWNRSRVQVAPPARRGTGPGATAAAPAPDTGASGPRLVLLAGRDAGERWCLADGLSVIGSDASADVRLADPSVASRHATIVVREGRARITDEGEASGIEIDGQRVSTGLLRDGSRLRIGALDLLYLDGMERSS
jgi:hypothetical protein